MSLEKTHMSPNNLSGGEADNQSYTYRGYVSLAQADDNGRTDSNPNIQLWFALLTTHYNFRVSGSICVICVPLNTVKLFIIHDLLS